LHTTPNIIKAIKLRMRRAGRAARMGKTETYRLFVTEPAGRYSLENFGVDGRIIFKWILNKQSEGGRWSWIRQVAGHCAELQC